MPPYHTWFPGHLYPLGHDVPGLQDDTASLYPSLGPQKLWFAGVGASVGNGVGLDVGALVGFFVGFLVGNCVGMSVGSGVKRQSKPA